METFEEWWKSGEYKRRPLVPYAEARDLAQEAWEAGCRSRDITDTPQHKAIMTLAGMLCLDLVVGDDISANVVRAVRILKAEEARGPTRLYEVTIPNTIKHFTIKFEGATDEVNIHRR